jgi:hypothetical protein
MARKVFIEVKVKLVVNLDEGIEVSKFMEEVDYNFTSTLIEADVEDTEILDYEVTDSK